MASSSSDGLPISNAPQPLKGRCKCILTRPDPSLTFCTRRVGAARQGPQTPRLPPVSPSHLRQSLLTSSPLLLLIMLPQLNSTSRGFNLLVFTFTFLTSSPLDCAPVELHKDQQRIQSSCFHSSSRFLRLGFQLNVVFQIWQSVCTSAASLRDASCTVSAGKRSKAAQWSDIIHHLIL